VRHRSAAVEVGSEAPTLENGGPGGGGPCVREVAATVVCSGGGLQWRAATGKVAVAGCGGRAQWARWRAAVGSGAGRAATASSGGGHGGRAQRCVCACGPVGACYVDKAPYQRWLNRAVVYKVLSTLAKLGLS
jgi:hypothetical protein